MSVGPREANALVPSGPIVPNRSGSTGSPIGISDCAIPSSIRAEATRRLPGLSGHAHVGLAVKNGTTRLATLDRASPLRVLFRESRRTSRPCPQSRRSPAALRDAVREPGTRGERQAACRGSRTGGTQSAGARRQSEFVSARPPRFRVDRPWPLPEPKAGPRPHGKVGHARQPTFGS